MPGTLPRLLGMVHLLPLPGSPRYRGDFAAVLEAARRDACALAEAGFPAVLVENFGDAPFFADSVPPSTVAAITLAVQAVAQASALPVAVNVLRNDALAALGVAAATGAFALRVNVLSGAMFTDQGLITGRAAELARARAAWAPAVKVLADVMVKHSLPPPGLEPEQAAADTWERGGADALIVSGPATGEAPTIDRVARIRKAVPEAPLLVGSGATAANLGSLAEVADGVIIGTALKVDGRTTAPVDPARAAAVVESARRAGWV